MNRLDRLCSACEHTCLFILLFLSCSVALQCFSNRLTAKGTRIASLRVAATLAVVSTGSFDAMCAFPWLPMHDVMQSPKACIACEFHDLVKTSSFSLPFQSSGHLLQNTSATAKGSTGGSCSLIGVQCAVWLSSLWHCRLCTSDDWCLALCQTKPIL